MGIDGAGVAEVIVVPDAVKNLFPGEGDALIFHKVGQKLKLFETKLDGLAVNGDRMGSLVDDDAFVFQALIVIALAGAAKDRFHSGHQGLRGKRLGHIFIYPQVKALQLIPLIGLGGEHDDGHLGISAHLFADLPSVHFRHHNVQNDQSDILLLEEDIQSLRAVGSLHYLEIALYQKVPYQLAHSALIINYQYFQLLHRKPHFLLSFT